MYPKCRKELVVEYGGKVPRSISGKMSTKQNTEMMQVPIKIEIKQ